MVDEIGCFPDRAILYEDGKGVTKDLVQAHAWTSIAASNGDGRAKVCLPCIENKMTSGQKAEAKKLACELSPR